MEIKNIQKEIHQDAKKKGFWDSPLLEPDYIPTLGTIYPSEEVKNLFISQKLMLIVSELGEALESLRNNRRARLSYDDLAYFELQEPFDSDYFEDKQKDTFEDELADTVIRILDLAEWMGIDLETCIKLKMRYNKSRPAKHDKKF